MVATCMLLALSAYTSARFQFQAQFVEACSCKDVCVTEITGRDAGCHGLGAFRFFSGSYGGSSIAGTGAAFMWDSGKWVRLVVDAPQAKRQAVAALMKAFLKDWGSLESVDTGSVRIFESSRTYKLAVDRGKTAALAIKPIFGGDGKTAVVHANLASPMHSSLMQGETVDGSFNVSHPFLLRRTNGFYNMHVQASGRI